MPKRNPISWETIPVKTRIIFLVAVFCVFAGIGFANDIIDMGRWTAPRLAWSVVVIGGFAVAYAVNGFIFRNRSWKVLIPLIVVQFAIMGFLANRFRDAPIPARMDAAQTNRLHNRMLFDGVAVIVTVVLGYVGFVHVSINEARRYARTQAEKATLESEMAAAREVQRVMVPEVLPAVRGYAIESVYRPASEVGGDFFQVIPLRSGRTLLAIGDVSGKGLRAAMIVSMIVGMLRTLSGFTEEPADILADLNHRECDRGERAFATCLVIRFEEDGKLTLANAGHPPLYLNGAELPFAGSLPLGIAETADYAQTTLEMGLGDRAVLFTDGVVEARNPAGELFGFPRVEEMLRNGASAGAVAEAAQQYGQNDDLTVIGITRVA
jgi:hypothetical protein